MYWKDRRGKGNDKTNHSDKVGSYSPISHYFFLFGIDQTIASEPMWWQRLSRGPMYQGKNPLGNDIYQKYYGGIAPSGSWIRFNPKDFLKLYKVLRNLQW